MASLQTNDAITRAKAPTSTCVLCLLLFCIFITTFIYSDMSFDPISFFIDENTSERDSNLMLSNIYQTSSMVRKTMPPTRSKEVDKNVLSLPKLIFIGGIFTGTSTLEQLLCQTMYFSCCLPSIHDDSLYDGNYDYTSQMLHNAIFSTKKFIPNINITNYNIQYLNLSFAQIHFNIEGILEYIPIQKYVSSYCDMDANNDGNKNILIRNTIYHQNPVTAAIFAHFASKYDTKIIFELRDPIDRWWSVDVTQPNSESISTYVLNQGFTQRLINFFGDDSKSNDDIISVYYQWYFTMKGDIKFELINSFYCVYLMFWIKQFDIILEGNGGKKTSDYFKIIQTEYVFDNMIQATQLIYCWEKGECNDEVKKRIARNIEVNTIQSPDMTANNQTDQDIKVKMKLFNACNSRLDRIIKKRPELVLGKWKSWNEMHS